MIYTHRGIIRDPRQLDIEDAIAKARGDGAANTKPRRPRREPSGGFSVANDCNTPSKAA